MKKTTMTAAVLIAGIAATAYAHGGATGIVKELYKEGTVEDLSRYENVQELLNAIKEFTETPDDEGELLDKSLGSYLQQITLLTDADKEDPEMYEKGFKILYFFSP